LVRLDLIAAVFVNLAFDPNLIGVGYRLQSMGALTRARTMPISTLDELVRSAPFAADAMLSFAYPRI
jgi:hypothetical protein